MKVDLAIIGGGPAGMAAAVAAYDKGIKNIVIIERGKELGGILNQCIHHGFGLHTFKEELTGPEYAIRYVAMIEERQIPCLFSAMVVDIDGRDVDGKDAEVRNTDGRDAEVRNTDGRGAEARNKDGKDAEAGEIDIGGIHHLTVMQDEKGRFLVEARAVILAMGCRERPRGALNIPGYRPSGIFTAGQAQHFVNMEGYLPGRNVIILGSGDIGLIMARRMKLQGADVKMVVEIMPYSGGLTRNIVQCLEDYDIPLKMSHTIIDIDGKDRLKGVVVAKVDENMKPLPDTSEYVPCDTLLLSCGLIPENELTVAVSATMDDVTGGPVVNEKLETTVRGIFACGNVLHVHDLVDHVSREATAAGYAAADYILADASDWGEAKRPKIPPKTRYTPKDGRDFDNQLVCIGCPASCLITIDKGVDGSSESLKISGNSCPVGEEYARKEVTAPTRYLASFMRIAGGSGKVVSVKTAADIPKGKIFGCMKEIRGKTASAPVFAGDILIHNVAGTGVDVVATANRR
jgi:CxxC motif-containing protein/thioredoxin reductase